MPQPKFEKVYIGVPLSIAWLDDQWFVHIQCYKLLSKLPDFECEQNETWQVSLTWSVDMQDTVVFTNGPGITELYKYAWTFSQSCNRGYI